MRCGSRDKTHEAADAQYSPVKYDLSPVATRRLSPQEYGNRTANTIRPAAHATFSVGADQRAAARSGFPFRDAEVRIPPSQPPYKLLITWLFLLFRRRRFCRILRLLDARRDSNLRQRRSARGISAQATTKISQWAFRGLRFCCSRVRNDASKRGANFDQFLAPLSGRQFSISALGCRRLGSKAVETGSTLLNVSGDAPDFVEVGEAGIAVGDAMRRERRVQLVG